MKIFRIEKSFELHERLSRFLNLFVNMRFVV